MKEENDVLRSVAFRAASKAHNAKEAKLIREHTKLMKEMEKLNKRLDRVNAELNLNRYELQQIVVKLYDSYTATV